MDFEELAPIPPATLPRIVEKTLPLREERVQAWAAAAVKRSEERTIRDHLAYEMIAYYWKLRPDEVRGRIQAVRKFNK